MKLDIATKQLVQDMKYLTLATVTAAGDPWITPLFYAYDDHYTFYWYSRKNTDHSINIEAHPKVSVSIYDQNISEERANGLYMVGTACEIAIDEVEKVSELYVMRAYPGDTTLRNDFVQMTQDFKNTSPLRFYKFTPEKAWVLGDSQFWNNKWLDYRKEI